MQTIETGEGPAFIVKTRGDATALWDWLKPYTARQDYLGWDGETNGVQNTFHRDFRLRTAQMSDGQVGWVVLAERTDFDLDMRTVIRECTRVHPRWVAHFAENDIRFAHCGAPGSVRTDSIEAHFSDTQPLVAWYDPRTVTSHDVFDDYGRPIALPRALKPVGNRILGIDTLTEAERDLVHRFRELDPGVEYINSKGETAYRPRTTKAAKTWGFANIPDSDPVYQRYAALDAMIELRLFHVIREELIKRGQWTEALATLRRQWHVDLMTLRGMLVDGPYAHWVHAHFRKIVNDREPFLAGHGIGSSGMGPAVGTAFERLGVRSTRQTPSGGPSWDKTMVQTIIDSADQAITPQHHQAVELAKVVKTVRQATKFIPAYIQPMLEALEADGRIHCSMREIGAVTSRQSAERPAVQQMPKRTSQLIRAAFIAPEGWMIVSSDLKQGEPRTMAALSGDENLQADIEAGDINSALAKLTYGDKFVPADGKDANTPSYDLRQRGKAGFLADCYGGGLRKLASSLLLDVPTEEAATIRKRWHARYSALHAYGNKINNQPAVVLDDGWIVPLWDRYYVDSKGVHCGTKPSRKGLNAATQGNQAVIMRRARDKLIDWGWSWAIIMLVHDEIVGCVPEHLSEPFRAALEAAMTMDFHGFPIRCDATIEGRSWMPQDQFNEEMAVALVAAVDD